mmetsp:Transcript_5950/g.27440  ORF Transcript_5950/g.27440 Transcript_5950/m.27440 type:complete len:218 (+) Transcript_5950:1544-2197(+)
MSSSAPVTCTHDSYPSLWSHRRHLSAIHSRSLAAGRTAASRKPSRIWVIASAETSDALTPLEPTPPNPPPPVTVPLPGCISDGSSVSGARCDPCSAANLRSVASSASSASPPPRSTCTSPTDLFASDSAAACLESTLSLLSTTSARSRADAAATSSYAPDPSATYAANTPKTRTLPSKDCASKSATHRLRKSPSAEDSSAAPGPGGKGSYEAPPGCA